MYQAGRTELSWPLPHIIIKTSEHEHSLNHYQDINNQHEEYTCTGTCFEVDISIIHN